MTITTICEAAMSGTLEEFQRFYSPGMEYPTV